MTEFPKINFGKLIDQLLEAKEDRIILYQITTENFLPYLDDFGDEVKEAAVEFYRKNIGYFSPYDDPIPTKVKEVRSQYSELQILCKIINEAQQGERVTGNVWELKRLSNAMSFDAPAPIYKVTPEAKKNCRCMLLKYLIEKGGSGFNHVNSFLTELQKQIDTKAHNYYHMDFLLGFLTELDKEGLVRFESNNFNKLVERRKFRPTDYYQQTFLVNDTIRTVRGLGDFEVKAKITDKGEKFFNDECQQKEKEKGNKKGEIPIQNFESYLNAKGKKLYPYLVKPYANAKPEIIAFMLLALEGLKFLTEGSLTNNKTALHAALKNTFGKIGTRQSLTTNLNRLAIPDDYQSKQIQIHANEISKAGKS